MAGNPCEELSPTEEKRKKRKRKTEPDLAKGSSLINHTLVRLVIYLRHTYHSPNFDNLPVPAMEDGLILPIK